MYIIITLGLCNGCYTALISFTVRSCVRVVSSNRAGMGKTHCIQNMASVLAEFRGTSTVRVAVPIHGPTLSVENLIKSLTEYGMNEQHCIMHLDIAPNVSNYLNIE